MLASPASNPNLCSTELAEASEIHISGFPWCTHPIHKSIETPRKPLTPSASDLLLELPQPSCQDGHQPWAINYYPDFVQLSTKLMVWELDIGICATADTPAGSCSMKQSSTACWGNISGCFISPIKGIKVTFNMKKEIAAGKTPEEEFFNALNGARWSLPHSLLS